MLALSNHSVEDEQRGKRTETIAHGLANVLGALLEGPLQQSHLRWKIGPRRA